MKNDYPPGCIVIFALAFWSIVMLTFYYYTVLNFS